MDLVSYSEARYNELVEAFRLFVDKLAVRDVRFVPVVATDGDNIVHRSQQMDWYRGETVLNYLEGVYTGADANRVDLRLPVQYVIRHRDQYRGYAGTIESGALRVGEEVVALPSERRANVTSILLHGRHEVQECGAGDAVAVTLSKEIDIARGSMLVRAHNIPKVTSTVSAIVIWCSEERLAPGERLLLRHTSQEVRAKITDIEYVIDVHDLHRKNKGYLELNDIARVLIQSQAPLFIDAYQRNRATGNFIVIHPLSNKTIAAGMVVDRDSLYSEDLKRLSLNEPTEDIYPPRPVVSAQKRACVWGDNRLTIWLTGLSGAGKTSIAQAFEQRLITQGQGVVVLDGDTLRSGLNADLGFSRRDRTEHIRRTAELAKLLNRSGVMVVCSLISPFIDPRAMARDIIGADSFVEVFVNASLAVCEARDPHGLYARARAGEVAEFTGIDASYEPPLAPKIVLDTENTTIEECLVRLSELLGQLPGR